MVGQPKSRSLKVAGLFAGIGGIELGLSKAGHKTEVLCELDPGAVSVLKSHFEAPIIKDVRDIESFGNVDLVAAGFPCQDLSQAGKTAGISGQNSSLVGHVFRLLDMRRRSPTWLLLENVSFMLHLDRGKSMKYLIDQLDARGFRWAYRVVDSRAFGLPQRRQRVIILASRREDPRDVLFAEDSEPHEPEFTRSTYCGFYWTEGLTGLGWAIDAVPTLKGGSTVGIPSPPAIWNPRNNRIGTPEIRDAERLQGFPPDWTLPALSEFGVRRGHRWKLVGNAVSVPVARWIGNRLASPGKYDRLRDREQGFRKSTWPKAAWGYKGKIHGVDISLWPLSITPPHLSEFLEFPLVPLSARAASGFRDRMNLSTLRFRSDFRDAIEAYADQTRLLQTL